MTSLHSGASDADIKHLWELKGFTEEREPGSLSKERVVKSSTYYDKMVTLAVQQIDVDAEDDLTGTTSAAESATSS